MSSGLYAFMPRRKQKLFRPHIQVHGQIAELDVGLEGVGTLSTVLEARRCESAPKDRRQPTAVGQLLSDAKELSFVNVAQGPSHLTTRTRIGMGCASVGTPRERYVARTVSQAQRNTKPSQHVESS